MANNEKNERQRERSNWPIRVRRLGEEAIDDTTPEQRIAMMWELAVQAWAIAGKPIPDYDRAHTPVRILRRGDEGDS